MARMESFDEESAPLMEGRAEETELSILSVLTNPDAETPAVPSERLRLHELFFGSQTRNRLAPKDGFLITGS